MHALGILGILLEGEVKKNTLLETPQWVGPDTAASKAGAWTWQEPDRSVRTKVLWRDGSVLAHYTYLWEFVIPHLTPSSTPSYCGQSLCRHRGRYPRNAS